MNILPKISSVDVFTIKENDNNYTYINLNKSDWITFKNTDKSDNNILQDLVENNAFATMLLYLNENYILQIGITNDIFKKSNGSINDYLKECEDLLYKNTKIVEEVGIPLCNINGYKIFEGAGYILRGNGKKKIKESFKEGVNWEEETLDLFPAIKSEVIKMINNNTNKWDIFDFIDGQVRAYSISKEEGNELKNLINDDLQEDAEGTQTTDIASKTDQNMNKKITTSKKKYYDILLSDFTESDNMNIINKGFLKNSKGQYERGNYILVKEGETYLAIHKNKLKGGN